MIVTLFSVIAALASCLPVLSFATGMVSGSIHCGSCGRPSLRCGLTDTVSIIVPVRATDLDEGSCRPFAARICAFTLFTHRTTEMMSCTIHGSNGSIGRPIAFTFCSRSPFFN